MEAAGGGIKGAETGVAAASACAVDRAKEQGVVARPAPLPPSDPGPAGSPIVSDSGRPRERRETANAFVYAFVFFSRQVHNLFFFFLGAQAAQCQNMPATTRAATGARPPDCLASAVARLAALPQINHRPVSQRGEAAVLVALFPAGPASTPHVLLTRRPATLSSHAGEVCLPGGRSDASDGGDPALTALREAREEVGLESGRVVRVLGTRPPVLSKHLLSVTPVMAELWATREEVDGGLQSRLGLTLNPAEVEAAFAVPLSIFVDGPSSSPTLTSCAHSFRDARFGSHRAAPPFRLHFFDVVPTEECGGRGAPFIVWGLTAGVLIEVAALALGRQPAFQAGPDAAPGLAFDRIWAGKDGRPTVREVEVEEAEEAA